MPSLSYIEDNQATFPAAATMGAYLRVKYGASGLTLAAATEQAIGYLTGRGAVNGSAATVRLLSAPSWIGIANEAVSIGAALYAGAGGKVTDTKPADGKIIGVAASAAGADGDPILILPVDARDHT